jgi:hypothetical protein
VSTRPAGFSDGRAWTSSIVLGLVFLLLFSVYTLFGLPSISFLPRWPVHADTWMATSVSRAITHGAFAHLYSRTGYDALPLWPILLVPVVAGSDALGRSGTLGAHPTMALMVVPYSLMVGVLVLHAGRTLAWSLGHRNRLWLVQGCLLMTVVLPCAVAGHMEDALAIAFLLYALRRYLAGQLDSAALLLAVAISSKQWAILALPLLVAFASASRRLRFLSLALSLPALLGAAALMLDFTHAYPLLLAPSAFTHNPGIHLGATMVLGERASRLARPCVLAGSLLIARLVRKRDPASLMCALAATLLLRPLFEPLLFPYYLAPGLAILGIIGFSAADQPTFAGVIPPIALMLWALDTTVSGITWWIVALLLLVLTARPPIRAWTLSKQLEREAPAPVSKALSTR